MKLPAHTDNMRRKKCVQRSIAHTEKIVTKYDATLKAALCYC